MTLLIRGARVLTLAGASAPRRGRALGELGVIAAGDVLVEGERIAAVGPAGSVPAPRGAGVIEAAGRVLMPGFIDAHTHACWAGERLEEWERRLRGESYLDILKAGGGIMSTVRAVRGASQEELERGLRDRLAEMLRGGTTTVEVKSGYGLTTADELKMLRAIRAAWRATGPMPTVIPTALLGHAIDPAPPRAEFVRGVIDETLPAVHEEFPGVAVDAYCEEGAWTRAECEALFERALALGHPVRVHADQFNSLGMVGWAAERAGRVLSVDHLEATDEDALRRLGASGVFGVALPATGFHTDGRYMNARAFVDAPGGGGALVIATNRNPGSAPTGSMPFVIALAVRKLGLTPAEAIAACTVNAAALLGLADRGVIAPGKRADLVLLRHRDERMLAHELGGNPVEAVVVGGAVVG